MYAEDITLQAAAYFLAAPFPGSGKHIFANPEAASFSGSGDSL
jgi:hypothetical protein